MSSTTSWCSNSIHGEVFLRDSSRQFSSQTKYVHSEFYFEQLNLHKSITATSNLVERLTKCSNFIICVQEPYQVNGKIRSLPVGANVHYVNNSQLPRAAIIGAKNVNLWYDSTYSDNDTATVMWTTGNPNMPEVYIVSAYMDILDTEVVNRPIRKLVRHCSRNKVPLIICVDSNAHSELWGSPEANSRGEILEEFILQNGLEVQNVGCKPTFTGRDTATIIDITLTLNVGIKNWRVGGEVTH